MNSQENENKYLRAKEQVREIKKFYTGLMFYVVFIIGLAGLNYYTNQFRNAWFLWVAFFWGIGIVIKAFKVFKWLPYLGKDWEERKIKEFMENDKDTKGNRWN